ncbi:MetQ/NlpA family ABC transporter substrate-binding protein [Actinobacillus equuli]|uniref:MetQ/NlpA family ABC transporter substrate-binding protein n=1 Tax=Actinobacillus equuli TaxID=718 RepID=UPI002442FE28|nr:MetQ/NlpA family ABC transporter substrate-binding protein [Actinobacillus equuli]WGE74556.1 MetQ/NlpA family ABC transporter substrate-binding protein [Actinobacillus equuli subsp. haemolyticus]WGE77681.1 MetQ/NlpA family ABC transporter substrate-binding protein [Actinobacillus equuli subsp. haemolyticus]
MNIKKLFGLAVVSALTLTGCKEEKAADTAKVEARTLTVGVMQGPEAQVNEVAARIAKEKYNLDVKLVEFSEYTQPNYALSHGDLDVNAFQSVPFFEREMKEKGYKFVAQANTFVFPIAGYSKTVKAIADLKEGAKIAISNELSTAGRSLLLLQANGVIKLKDPTNLYATEIDIVENPKKVKITQVDTALLTRALDDVDLAIINNNYAGQAGLTPEKDGVIVEAKDSPYVNLIVSREDNKDNPAIKDFVKAFQTEEVYQEALKHFPGGIVKGW